MPDVDNGRRSVYEYECVHGKSLAVPVNEYHQSWAWGSYCRECENTLNDECRDSITNERGDILPFERDRPVIYKKKDWEPGLTATVTIPLCKKHHKMMMLFKFSPGEFKKSWGDYRDRAEGWLMGRIIQCWKCNKKENHNPSIVLQKIRPEAEDGATK